MVVLHPLAVADPLVAQYHRLFNAQRVLRYMVETVAGERHSEPYEWAKEVYS